MDNFQRDELDDSEEDTVTDYSQMNATAINVNNIDSTDFVLRTMPSSTLVPTISVTPHSSAERNYPVLGNIQFYNFKNIICFSYILCVLILTEENIQQLHEIHDVIQQMRDSATLGLAHVTCLIAYLIIIIKINL